MARAFEETRVDWCQVAQCLVCILVSVAAVVLLLLGLWFVGIPVFGAARDFAGSGDSLLPPGFAP